MRFSLATLLHAVLLISTLSVVWAHRNSWHAVGLERELSTGGGNAYIVSPDSTRVINIFNDQNHCAIYARENYPRVQIHRHTIKQEVVTHAFFVDDETIMLGCGYAGKELSTRPLYQEYRRLYPEEWWGHFLRPELYAAAALFVALILRVRRARRERPRLSAAFDSEIHFEY